MINRVATFFLSFFLVFQGGLFGWWETGHQQVAAFAYERLMPEVRVEVDRLAATFREEYPENATFVSLSTWLDEVKQESGGLFGSFHHTDGIYDPEGILSEQQREVILARNEGADIVAALKQAERSLERSGSDRVRALMLAIAIHCVADIHQPLHCVSRYSREHPLGDRGGNLTPVKSKEAKNVHAFWDSGLGLLGNNADLQAFEEELNRIVICEFRPTRDPREWAYESKLIAESVGYRVVDDQGNIQEDVLPEAQHVVVERIWLAGSRLADLLNRSISKSLAECKSAA